MPSSFASSELAGTSGTLIRPSSVRRSLARSGLVSMSEFVVSLCLSGCRGCSITTSCLVFVLRLAIVCDTDMKVSSFTHPLKTFARPCICTKRGLYFIIRRILILKWKHYNGRTVLGFCMGRYMLVRYLIPSNCDWGNSRTLVVVRPKHQPLSADTHDQSDPTLQHWEERKNVPTSCQVE